MVLLGSCFAVNMADKFDYFQFRHTVNPFGILFHPLTIERLVERALAPRDFVEAEVFFHNERWHFFDAHSELSHPDKAQLLAALDTAVAQTRDALQTATHIVVTYGTAWVYRHLETGRVVANCHKVPQREFTKELLSVSGIVESVENTLAMVAQINPSATVVFTVSPVRHLKDGLVENQRSKAHLIAALHEVLDGSHHHYFPAFEIMMDELRDYRFYATDWIHPNQTAIEYIWEKFAGAWIDPAAQAVMDRVDSIRKRTAHRPFNPESESHRKFLGQLQSDIAQLQSQCPHMRF